jgi:hypothetical protein
MNSINLHNIVKVETTTKRYTKADGSYEFTAHTIITTDNTGYRQEICLFTHDHNVFPTDDVSKF